MPLTPTDVANKQFRIAFRGYSLDEVDAFLDEVETELSRLLRDADGGKAGAGTAAAPAAGGAATSTAVSQAPTPAVRPGRIASDNDSGNESGEAAKASRPEAESPAPLAGMGGQEAALRTLLLAQRTADEAIAEARAEADELLTAARREAETTVTEARTEADRTLGAARTESEQTLTSARTEAEQGLTSARGESESTVSSANAEAEQTLTQARTEAEQTLTRARTEAEQTLTKARTEAARIDEEVAERIAAKTGDLEIRRSQLDERITELQAFEREYRTRLKAYLENQLRDLQQAGPDDAGAGVPAGARTAAVSGPDGGRRTAASTAPPPETGAQVGPFTPAPAAQPGQGGGQPNAGS